MAKICQPATDWQKAEICLDTSFVESPKYALAYAAHKIAILPCVRINDDDDDDDDALTAAFDTVDRDILLERLSRMFGMLKWFHSYLADKTEYVLYNGMKSAVKTVMFGVPQGSVLGPLLFLLYTAKLELIARQSHLYADDSKLYVFSRLHDMESAEQHLLRCLDETARWMQFNCLKARSDRARRRASTRPTCK